MKIDTTTIGAFSFQHPEYLKISFVYQKFSISQTQGGKKSNSFRYSFSKIVSSDSLLVPKASLHGQAAAFEGYLADLNHEFISTPSNLQRTTLCCSILARQRLGLLAQTSRLLFGFFGRRGPLGSVSFPHHPGLYSATRSRPAYPSTVEQPGRHQ